MGVHHCYYCGKDCSQSEVKKDKKKRAEEDLIHMMERLSDSQRKWSENYENWYWSRPGYIYSSPPIPEVAKELKDLRSRVEKLEKMFPAYPEPDPVDDDLDD